LHKLGNDVYSRESEPFNDAEPVDSSAAAIGVQGLIRLGRYLNAKDTGSGDRYIQAGLTTMKTLLSDKYLSLDESHQGLILHSVYHRPNGWDYIQEGHTVPCGESSMWGDYHAREAALFIQRLANDETYYTFYL